MVKNKVMQNNVQNDAAKLEIRPVGGDGGFVGGPEPGWSRLCILGEVVEELRRRCRVMQQFWKGK